MMRRFEPRFVLNSRLSRFRYDLQRTPSLLVRPSFCYGGPLAALSHPLLQFRQSPNEPSTDGQPRRVTVPSWAIPVRSSRVFPIFETLPSQRDESRSYPAPSEPR